MSGSRKVTTKTQAVAKRGTTVSVGRRKISEAEEERVYKAARCAALLKKRCRGFSSKSAWQYFVGPVASYGWRAGFLPRKPWMTFLKVSPELLANLHRASNPSWCKVLTGGSLFLDIKQVACKLFARLYRRRLRCLGLRQQQPDAQPLAEPRRYGTGAA